MKINYFKDSDYIEVFFKSGVENYADFDSKNFAVFRSEKDDKVIGYGSEAVSENFEEFLRYFDGLQKLAIIVKVARKKMDLSQDEIAKELKLTRRQYQRIENGENTKMDVILRAKGRFPHIPFSYVLME